MIFALSIFLGLLSIINKILLFLEKKSGWLSGMVIGVVSGFYFWLIGLKILAIAEFCFFIVMLHGHLSRIQPSRKIAMVVDFIVSAVSILLAYFLYAGVLTLVEAVSAIAFIWGGNQLVAGRKFVGWLLILLAHLATAVAGYYAGQELFASLQLVSAAVCFYAALSTLISYSRS